MSSSLDLHRLSQEVHPSDALRRRIDLRIQQRIGGDLRALSNAQTVDSSARVRILESITHRISPALGLNLERLASHFPRSPLPLLREAIFLRLEPRSISFFGQWMKWSFAFVLLAFLVRISPFVFTAPSLRAQTGIYLLPKGDVSVLHGSLSETVTDSRLLDRATTIRTGANGSATIILHDDGVLRLAPNTELSLADLSDRPMKQGDHTATLAFGQMWMFGLVPSFVDGLSIHTRLGDVVVNEGSASVFDDGTTVAIASYDRGVTVESSSQQFLLIAPERLTARGNSRFVLSRSAKREQESLWVQENLQYDAAHRSDLAAVFSERKKDDTAILPTSLLYPAKRFAEEVDVFFAFNATKKSEKRLAQANSRLHEAFALLDDGKESEASIPFSEYRATLLALASSTQDNLVQSLIREQVASASTSLLDADQTSSGSMKLLLSAVQDVSTVLPDANLRPEDIQGYILIDRLSRMHKDLQNRDGAANAVAQYQNIRPYLSTLLRDQSETNALLKKEAIALLVSSSHELASASLDETARRALTTDIAQYLPQEKELVLASEEELNAQVQSMLSRMFVFRHPRSRYNQLLVEMQGLQGNPQRGTLLRRLKVALPDMFGEYVNTEIKKLGDELKVQKEAQ